MLMLAVSTWRVVAAAFCTSPNWLSRNRVRSREVLPVLVCPTMARWSGGIFRLSSNDEKSCFAGKQDYVYGVASLTLGTGFFKWAAGFRP